MARTVGGAFEFLGKRAPIVGGVIVISTGIAEGKSLSEIGTDVVMAEQDLDLAFDLVINSGLAREAENNRNNWSQRHGTNGALEVLEWEENGF